MTAGDGGRAPRVLNVLRGEALESRSTPFGEVGTMFSGSGLLPAGERCRAYRWPREADDATVFVAAYPAH